MSALGGDIPRPDSEHADTILGSHWPAQSESAWRHYAHELFSGATRLLREETEQDGIVMLLADQAGRTADALMGLAQARQHSLRGRTDTYRRAHQAAERAAGRLVAAKINMRIQVEVAEATITEAKTELIPAIVAAQAVGDGPLAQDLTTALLDRCTAAIDAASDAVAAEDTAAATEVAALAHPFLAAVEAASRSAGTGGAGAAQPVDYRPALGDAATAHQPAPAAGPPAQNAEFRPALGGITAEQAHQPAATTAGGDGPAAPDGSRGDGTDRPRPGETAGRGAPATPEPTHTSAPALSTPPATTSSAASPLSSLGQALAPAVPPSPAAGSPAPAASPAGAPAAARAASAADPAGVPAGPGRAGVPGVPVPIAFGALGAGGTGGLAAASAGPGGIPASPSPSAASPPPATPAGVGDAPAASVAAGASASGAPSAGMGPGAIPPAVAAPAAALGAPATAAAVPTTLTTGAAPAATAATAAGQAAAGPGLVTTTTGTPPVLAGAVPADRDEAAQAAAGIVAAIVAQARRRGHGNLPVAVTVLSPASGGLPVAWLATGWGPSWLPAGIRIPDGVRLAVTDPVVGRDLWAAAADAGGVDPVDQLVAHARAAAEPPSALVPAWRVLAIAGTGHPAQIEAAASTLAARGIAVDAREVEPAEPGEGGQTRCAAAFPRLAARVEGYSAEQRRRLVAMVVTALVDARPSVEAITRMAGPAAVAAVSAAWVALHQAMATTSAGLAFRAVMSAEAAALASAAASFSGCAELLYAAHLAGVSPDTIVTGEACS